jgi:hypothetical protein
MSKKELYIIIFGIIAIAIAVLFMVLHTAEAPAKEGEATRDAITADDQSIERKHLVIKSVELIEDGYVVIHESMEGFPMDIVGVSSLLTSGVYTNVEVPVDVVVASGEELIALIHTDNGDGVFVPADDISVLDGEGSLVSTSIVVD